MYLFTYLIYVISHVIEFFIYKRFEKKVLHILHSRFVISFFVAFFVVFKKKKNRVTPYRITLL